MLADVFALELVLGDPVHRRGEVGHRGAEPAVAEVEVGLLARPAEIEVARLVVEGISERGRHRAAVLRVERAALGVPLPFAVGHDAEDVIGRLRREPVLDLPVHPLRGGGRG